MKRFKTLSKENAKEYFDCYTGRSSEQLNQFISELLTHDQFSPQSIDYSVCSLDRLWEWFYPQLEVHEIEEMEKQVELLPIWFEAEFIFGWSNWQHTYSKDNLWLIDAIGYYFAECCLRNIPSLSWEICSDDKIGLYNKPVLAGFQKSFDPLAHVIRNCGKVILRPQKNSPNALSYVLEYWRDNLLAQADQD